ncbi:hypothetical protein A2U01_0110265, partial [Trifolium medium]|nr:hypothetical protein [Trifolium medium]
LPKAKGFLLVKGSLEEECPRSKGLGEETRAKLRFSIFEAMKLQNQGKRGVNGGDGELGK